MERQVDYHEIEEHAAKFFRAFRWIIFGVAVGAVVPWADRLWVITYAPHKPNGSSDWRARSDAAALPALLSANNWSPLSNILPRNNAARPLGPLGKTIRNATQRPIIQDLPHPD